MKLNSVSLLNCLLVYRQPPTEQLTNQETFHDCYVFLIYVAGVFDQKII